MFEEPLDAVGARVMGCLIEKQLSTPEYYPLTLNALVLACNQATNRDPVMAVTESAVAEALEALRQAQWVWFVTPAGSRVQKYEQRLVEAQGLSIQEAAILAELLLRGPQTPGELRNRSTRMYAFQDLNEVETTLQVLQEYPAPLVAALPRQAGTKEVRWGTTLAERPVVEAQPVPQAATGRMAALEGTVETLKQELAQLRAEFEAFKNQF